MNKGFRYFIWWLKGILWGVYLKGLFNAELLASKSHWSLLCFLMCKKTLSPVLFCFFFSLFFSVAFCLHIYPYFIYINPSWLAFQGNGEWLLILLIPLCCCPAAAIEKIQGKFPFSRCGRGWMFVFLQNSYVEALTSSVLLFGGGAFGRWLALNGPWGLGLHDGVSVSIKRRPELALCYTCT